MNTYDAALQTERDKSARDMEICKRYVVCDVPDERCANCLWLCVCQADTIHALVDENDCGYLSAAGQFEYATRGDVARWWSCAQGFEVVVDLSPAAADALMARETVLVQAEVVK
ncbi:MAG: hypothetical protein WC565_09395 [Parcubacteria group bacterium]|jgi:hypothetical protein